MAPRHFVLATAGHVDHGKSALIKCLTGTDPDRLPEEKARGITIDLGFAFLPMTSADGEQIIAGIVDVPGHEDFVRNMIAGVGSIDLALLVVAADDGWMPQTEEHLQILMYLGVNRIVVAVTKADLGRVESVAEQIRHELEGTPFSRSRIIATSVHLGSGISELKDAILAEWSALPRAEHPEKPRLFLDRAFTLRGLGTVVTGTLAGGSLRVGQSVYVHPANFTTRIRSIQTHGRAVELAPAGARTALNLPDVPLGESARSVRRGDVITTLAADSSCTLDVLLEVSARQVPPKSKTRPLQSSAMVDVHHGTSRTPAKIVLLEGDPVPPGGQAFAQLRLSAPLFAFLGDRLVIRDRSQQQTLAGALVLDPDASRSSFRRAHQQAFLRARAAGWQNPDVAVGSEIARSEFVDISTLLRKSKFTSAEIAASIDRLRASGQVVVLGNFAAASSAWQNIRARAGALIDQAHATNPELPGLDLNTFRSAFRELSPEMVETLLLDLCQGNFLRKGQAIARPAHARALPAQLEPVASRIRQTLAAKPLDPPARKLVAPDRAAQQALQFLISQGSVVDISADLVLSREAFDTIQSAVRHFLSTSGPATTSQIRQELQTSRRMIVPLLEYLDRARVTRRIGDQRTLADGAIAGTAGSSD